MYGAGHAAGGSYQNVSIKGEGTVGEGLRSEQRRIFGTGRFLGDAETNRLKIFGEHEVEGDLSARSANVIGTLKIGGSMRFTRMRLKGLADISGSLCGRAVPYKRQSHRQRGLRDGAASCNRLYQCGGIVKRGRRKHPFAL